MNMNFLRKLPTPKEIKEMFPLEEKERIIKEQNDKEIKKYLLIKAISYY